MDKHKRNVANDENFNAKRNGMLPLILLKLVDLKS